MAPVKRVVISGYYGFGNGGDEALLLSLLRMLPESVQPIVLSHTPKQTAQLYRVITCPRMNGVAIMGWMRQSQAFIWGGGGLLQDRTSWRSPLYYLGLMGLAQQLGLITVAWAQGIGPLQYRWSRWLAYQGVRGCTAVSVRDRAAADLLESWGVPYELAPDPVWSLQPQGSFEPTPAPTEERPQIAVVLRAHPGLTLERLQRLTEGLVLLQQATQTRVILLPFQLDPQDPRRSPDHQIAVGIQARLPQASQIRVLRDPCHLRAAFEGVRLVISMRYHGIVMGAAAGCRCFGLSYDPKVAQLLRSLHMPGWELDQIPSDPQQIGQAWLEAYRQQIPLTPDQIRIWQQEGAKQGQILRQALGY